MFLCFSFSIVSSPRHPVAYLDITKAEDGNKFLEDFLPLRVFIYAFYIFYLMVINRLKWWFCRHQDHHVPFLSYFQECLELLFNYGRNKSTPYLFVLSGVFKIIIIFFRLLLRALWTEKRRAQVNE